MFIATSAVARSFGYIAPTLTIWQCLAQAARIRKTGAHGVSLATWILSCFVSTVWFCYGFIFHVTAEVVANTPAIIVSGIVRVPRGPESRQDRAKSARLPRRLGHHGSGHHRRVVPLVSLGPLERRRRQFDHHLPAPAGTGTATEGLEWGLDRELAPREPHVARLVRLRLLDPPTGARGAEFRHVPRGLHRLHPGASSPPEEQPGDRTTGAARRVISAWAWAAPRARRPSAPTGSMNVPARQWSRTRSASSPP